MAGYDERFAEVKERLARKQHLEAVQPSLQEQYSDVLAKVTELREIKASEQKDVDRLEQGSLAAFFLNVVGKKEEKLAKEQREAYQAAVKCDVAEKELYEIESRLNRTVEELATLQDCEKEYENLLQKKRNDIKRQGLPAAEEIIKLEKQLFEVEKKAKEIKEAVTAGTKAKELAKAAHESLDSADGWSTWDLFGGGFMTDMLKHGDIDEAQKRIEELQVQLRNFKTELTDVRIEANITIDIDEILKFADYVFDGFFSAYAVKQRVEDAIGQVEETEEKIEGLLKQLSRLEAESEKESECCRETMRRLITTTEV
ncbi:MAG: hypothetical protein E7268_03610 [Lachnospiraceae bacterium]|nr:hypothetical protein [Lachnospiraceae bacterium]